MNRKLATIETIDSIHAIPNADRVVRCRVRGWDVVVKKGEFSPGDRCVYFEIDSLLDTTDGRFAFLAPRGVRTDVDGNSGHVLKTARLRGTYSQGLVLPLATFPELDQDLPVSSDVTETLRVVKWDPPLPAGLSGLAYGRLPSWIPTTDEERIQNIPEILSVSVDWGATEKLDGASTTIWVDSQAERTIGVCSRNLDLHETEGNTLWRLARELDLHSLLSRLYPDEQVAIQGETYGPGIQGNPLKLKRQRFSAFSLILAGRTSVPRSLWPAEIKDLSVPVLDLSFPSSLEQALNDVDGVKSQISPDRLAEGVVWKSTTQANVTLPDGRIVPASFKAISNRYLYKNSQ